MKIVIPDDYQDAVRNLACFSKLDGHQVAIYRDTVKDLETLAARLQDAEALVLIRERTRITAELLERLLALNHERAASQGNRQIPAQQDTLAIRTTVQA